jgi:hypothetical protein
VARASPAGVSGGSAPLSSSFSACRTTIIVVESAVTQTQAAQAAKLKKHITISAPSTDNQIGVKNGLRCKLA